MGRAAKPAAKAAPRMYDAEQSMADIMKVATAEFADKGLSGARIDEIAAATRTSKRMIYYHFGSKEGLYLAVLEASYQRIREIEARLELEDLPPEDALRKLVAFTFDYQHDNEDFIRLVMNENIHRGENIAQLTSLVDLNSPAIELISRILERGRHQGLFRGDVDAIDVHMMISAYCFFRVGNRHTFGAIFGRDMLDPKRRNHYKQILGDMVAGHLTSPAVR